MKVINRFKTIALIILISIFNSPLQAKSIDDILKITGINEFIQNKGGFGTQAVESPKQLNQFGQLVGVWKTQQEMKNKKGEWVRGTEGYWIWKYALGGFMVQDLWYQSKDNLPSYLSKLNREYLLTAHRIFDASNNKWNIAWMANSANEAPGQDFGVFEAIYKNKEIIMSSPNNSPQYGQQRVVFSNIKNHTFKWRSEYSQDNGVTWVTVMRVNAKRILD